MGTLPGRCTLCERVVLGLEGHDWCLLPWMLPDEGADQVLPGPAHIRCLDDHEVAHLWAESVHDYYARRWPQHRTGLTGGIRWRLHASPPARRFYLWRADGRLSSFPYLAVATAYPQLGLTTEIAETTAFPGTPSTLEALLEVLELTDRYPHAHGLLTRHRGVLSAHYPLHLDASCRWAARALLIASV